MKKTQIIILAGGKGTRMKSDDPKALAKYKGKYFLQHILDTINAIDLPFKPIIVVCHKKDQIKKAIGNELLYAEQSEPLGTGHAVASAKNVAHHDHNTILVLSTDQPLISKNTIETLLTKHLENKPTITMATMLVPDFEEWRSCFKHFGRVIRKENGSVNGIVEYKDATQNEQLIKEVNPAVYAFDSDWLWKNIDLIKNQNAQNEYYLTDLIKMASEQGKRIEAVPVADLIEGFQPNSKEELQLLEKITKDLVL